MARSRQCQREGVRDPVFDLNHVVIGDGKLGLHDLHKGKEQGLAKNRHKLERAKSREK